MTTVVVGAGIVGAAVGYELARAGADVVIVDKALPGSGVTADSFAWIGGPEEGDVPDAATPLRTRVLEDYRRLERDVPGVRVRWHGALLCGADQPGPLIGAAEVARLEPHLRAAPAAARHLPAHGSIDPVAVTQALVRAARHHGARLMANAAVTAVTTGAGGVTGVRVSGELLPAEAVVLAAGVDTPVLCAGLGLDLPVAPSPALLMRFTAPPGLVRTLVVTPQLEVREAADGRLLVAAAYAGETGQDELRHAGEEMRRRLTATFDSPDVRLVGVRVGARPMPADGLPIVGPVPGVRGAYVAVMHSGITLGPSAARLVAAELVHRLDAEQLTGLRPMR